MSLQRNDLICQQAFIGGQWVNTPKQFAVNNPASGEKITEVADCGKAEIEQAIMAAQEPQKLWAQYTGKERAVLVRAWANKIMEHQADMAKILTMENGKPLAEAMGEVAIGCQYIEWFAEEAKRVYGETIPGHMRDKRLLVIKQPIGVVCAVTPWNFPHSMISRKAGAALAAGCAIIIKPAQHTPLSALAMAKLADEAGIPKGLISVVTCHDPKEVGEVMTTHPKVQKFSFTGSTAVGKMLMAQCTGTVKKYSMELGGNAPFIVFDDADLDKAVEGAMISKFRNAGQTCVCANRLYVQAGVYDAFIGKLKTAIEKLVVGNGLDNGVTQGPLIDSKAMDKVKRLLKNATDKGAKVVTGGKPHPRGGNFFEPTLLIDMKKEMDISLQEIFGPLCAVYKFEHDEEAIALANDTQFGLASYFYAKDLSRIFKTAESLETGMVGVNTGLMTTEVAPFGGIKESGVGKEGAHQGIDEYLIEKYICLSI